MVVVCCASDVIEYMIEKHQSLQSNAPLKITQDNNSVEKYTPKLAFDFRLRFAYLSDAVY